MRQTCSRPFEAPDIAWMTLLVQIDPASPTITSTGRRSRLKPPCSKATVHTRSS